MSHKSRVLGIGAIAMLAIVALSGGSATATNGGHFVSGSEHTLVKLATGGEHSITWWNGNGTVACGKNSHEGTITGTTVESLDLTSNWEEGCLTGDGKTSMEFKPNGCTFRFTIAAGTTATTEQTMHLICPAGKVYEVNQGSTCLLTMVPQTIEKAATYTTTEASGKHAITVDLHATIETQFHGGICIFMGTKQFTTLKGSAVLAGYNTALEPVDLTAT